MLVIPFHFEARISSRFLPNCILMEGHDCNSYAKFLVSYELSIQLLPCFFSLFCMILYSLQKSQQPRDSELINNLS